MINFELKNELKQKFDNITRDENLKIELVKKIARIDAKSGTPPTELSGTYFKEYKSTCKNRK